MAIAGHVSRQMLEHYSHVRLDLKRKALDGLSTGRVISEGKRIGYDTNYDATKPSGESDHDVTYRKDWSALADDFRTLALCQPVVPGYLAWWEGVGGGVLPLGFLEDHLYLHFH
jgi:hypothetical protein